MASGWPLQAQANSSSSLHMMAALTEIDTSENGRESRLFTVATITDGPCKKLQGIGSGSNQKNM